MNKKYLTLSLIIFTIISCACFVSFYQYLLNRCFWWECVPERNFTVLDWEIPLYLFPDGSFTEHITAPTDNSLGEVEAGFQTIRMYSGVAIYDIYRFSSVKNAITQFERDKESMISSETGNLWLVPDNITFSSETADDIYIACGYWSNRYRCKMIAYYQEYFIFFNTDINDQMTFERFENIVAYLDEQISSRLYP
jgi:hypothetical protein